MMIRCRNIIGIMDSATASAFWVYYLVEETLVYLWIVENDI